MKNRITGFTLMELVITIAIVGVLAAVAVPSYRELTLNNCLVTNVNAMVTSFNQARSEAAARRANVNVSAISGSWNSGWTVWVDNDDSGTYSDDEALRQVERTSCGGTEISEDTNQTVVTYRPTGGVVALATFRLCDDRTGETGREVDIRIVGRPSVADITCD